MTSNRRWLILPPAAALLLVLGPLSMHSASAAAERTGPTVASARQQQSPAPAPAGNGPGANDAATTGERTAPALPRTPDLMQVGSTLIGVLLLGGVGLVVLRRLRRGQAPGGGGIVALRQSLRLSPRQVVHAIEFEGRLLLVGEGERGVQLLHAQTAPSAADDEAAVRAAAARLFDADDDGAVPKNLAKNLVLPRPQGRPATAPRALTAAPGAAAKAAPAVATGRAAATRKALGDFRALLAKVGR